jgi:hypothetical protein
VTGAPTPPGRSLADPPEAPGSLSHPPAASAVLGYLSDLGAWHAQLHGALTELDRRAQAAADGPELTGDITLAMSLSESIDRRLADLTTTWDSGRVQGPELAAIAQLIWGRLPDPLGNPSAFSLTEATTLAAALEARLAGRLGAVALAGSGVAARIDPLRDTLDRCVRLATTLHRHDGDAEAIRAQLDALVDGSDGAALAAGFGPLADRAERLERDLIKETSLRASVQSAIAAFGPRLARLAAQRQTVEDLAQRCRDKIAGPPHLAVPDASVLGPGPTVPDGAGDPGSWTRAGAEVAAFDARLTAVDTALAQAQRSYGAPLDRRSDLRGLLGAYHDRAAKAGLVEDPALSQLHQAARSLLWTAPCDLGAAADAVAAYQQAVRVCTGAVREDAT